MTPLEWEALCDNCGKCCSITAPKCGVGYACPALDTTTNLCTQYDDRLTEFLCLKVKPCNVLDLWAQGVLPDSCAYVRHEKGQPPIKGPPCATLTPFELAPKAVRSNYERALKKWKGDL